MFLWPATSLPQSPPARGALIHSDAPQQGGPHFGMVGEAQFGQFGPVLMLEYGSAHLSFGCIGLAHGWERSKSQSGKGV